MRPPARPRVPAKPAVTRSTVRADPAPTSAGRTQSQGRTGARRQPARGTRDVATTTAPGRAKKSAKRRSPGGPARGRPTVSTAMARRLAERRAVRRHRLLATVAWWASGVAVLGVLVWGAFFSPLLSLEADQVEITGQGTTIDVEQVRAIVVQEAGVPMPRLDTIGLRNQILELGGVKDVAISRAWPHGLEVELTSREPAAAVPTPQGHVLVDTEGVQVGMVAQAPPDLPRIEVGLEPDDAPALHAALLVLAGLPSELAAQVTQVSAGTRDSVRTTLDSGQEVRWGSEDRMALKVAVVEALRGQAPQARVYDVSSPDLPVTR